MGINQIYLLLAGFASQAGFFWGFMASPVNDSYSVSSGKTIFAGMSVAHVWIIAGQSNASGRVPIAQAPSGTNPLTGVKTWKRTTHTTGEGAWQTLSHSNNQYDNQNQFGAELQLMKNANAVYDNAHLIKLADGGTSLAVDWAAASALRVSLITDHINDALNDLAANYDHVRVHGFYWDQGEQDGITEAHALAYQSNLESFISAVRAATVENLPFVARRMYSGISGAGGNYIDDVISAQDAAAGADSNLFLTNEAWSHVGDNLHLDATAQNNQGNVVFNQLKSLNSGLGLIWQS